MDAVAAPSRESFFALYWDGARPALLAIMLVCLMPPPRDERLRAEILHDVSEPWDELTDEKRVRYRAALLELMDVHDHNRRLAAKSRELRREKAA